MRNGLQLGANKLAAALCQLCTEYHKISKQTLCDYEDSKMCTAITLHFVFEVMVYNQNFYF